ncbi:hypothetical protein M427DRAFT_163091 [Gonapodya prolifera JEL478]|uniref:Ankyrin n=1 Tax=Gonapodya prolifera (strain JEL478) TaxID=1344416 RepID=A0A139AZ81_GONPJ|nr:hypothetical protein M427DRAFT_163091 [Gonapodya prolifera JEL478]|eukprot:KXS22058.1 hypothetical protein M427DRAFT_163091 [Gonapodya prolifera JEL478]
MEHEPLPNRQTFCGEPAVNTFFSGPGQMEEANAQLVEAVEAGNLEMVQVALAAGADPSLSRKSVTLHVKLRNGVTKTETHLMESVLAIAIRDEKIDIVKCLLARGCDPNRPIQWKISRWHTMWTQQKWDHQRWFEHDALRYPSALNFALAWGGRGFNKRGAHVNLHNPSNADHVCDDYPLSPNTEIVKVLLSHGAQVTDSILESAWELSDRTFARILAAARSACSRSGSVSESQRHCKRCCTYHHA